jgi:hypothetical protein
MSNVRKTFTAAAAAVFLTLATGCSEGVNPVGAVATNEDREAYEAARFLIPEGKAAADRELARISSGARPGRLVAPDVNDVLRRPQDCPAAAQGKLCEYTATLMGNADRDGTAVPEKVRAAAKTDPRPLLIRALGNVIPDIFAESCAFCESAAHTPGMSNDTASSAGTNRVPKGIPAGGFESLKKQAGLPYDHEILDAAMEVGAE